MFDWFEYYRLAQVIAGVTGARCSTEAKLRSSVSRAYYSVFITARNRLRDVEEMTLDRNKIHTQVIGIFQNHTDREFRWVGTRLFRLMTLRGESDYEDIVPDLSDSKDEALAMANETYNQIVTLVVPYRSRSDPYVYHTCVNCEVGDSIDPDDMEKGFRGGRKCDICSELERTGRGKLSIV